VTGWHPTDDELVLHFYGEADAEAARIDAHLRSCSSCRTTWEEVQETLSLVDAAHTPEPGPDFERVVWAHVQREMPLRAEPWWRRRWLAPVASGAALVLVTIGTAYWWQRPAVPAPAASVTPASPEASARTRERVLLSALGEHFEQTELLLVELMNASPDNRADLSYERSAADDLVFSGRLYRITAQQNGHVYLVQMLEDLESVLVEVARGPERPSGREVESLRARIDDASLLFKVRAVTDVIQVRQRELMSAND
jgi:hypothetical protein